MTTPATPLRRSALYVPASNVRALAKARELDADAIIIDLEDAVAPDAKAAARENALKALEQRDFAHTEVVIRVNALASEWGESDIDMLRGAGASVLLLPKVNEPRDLERARRRIAGDGASSTALWAMMESPMAVLNARDIARAAHDWGVACMVIGTNDLAKDTGVTLLPGRALLLPWIMTFAAAAHAYGLNILDGVFNGIDDAAGFEQECSQGRDGGMHGKTLIHPSQVAACNRIFSPTPEEAAWARKVVDAFEAPEAQGSGALRVEGKMVERLHAQMARATLDKLASIKNAQRRGRARAPQDH